MSIDTKALKDFILKEVKASNEANRQRHKNLDEWSKRFEALRSTSSLDDDVKKKPWLGASNVGIPIDATVVYTIQARLIKATFGVDPCISVRPGDMKHSTHIQRFINWEMWTEMQLFMDILMGYQGMLIDGDKIFKSGITQDEVYFDDDVILFVNSKGEPYLSPETGVAIEAESEDQPSIFDPKTLEEYKPKTSQVEKNRTTYYGPSITPIPIKNIIVPQNADNIDPSKIEWICHEFWKPYWWIDVKAEQNPDIYDTDELDKLYKEKDETRNMPEDEKLRGLGIEFKTKTKQFKFWEWHGKWEDKKGHVHELIALVAPEQKALLAVVPNRYYFKTGRRQFIHYTCFPQDGRFYGKGVPEWLRGVRSMLDALINMGLDNQALYNNPTILHDIKMAGFDPSEHRFGPGKVWGLRSIRPEHIRTLDVQTSQQQSMMREEMLFSIIQKLFGVNDYAMSGTKGMGHGGVQNKTAQGAMAIINEGNLRFDVLIKIIQEWANPEMATQIFKHFQMNRYSIMNAEGLNKPTEVFGPIMALSNEELDRNFEYVFKGNTSTINPIIEQQQVSFLYDKFTGTKNPFVVDDPEVMHDLTEMMLNDYNVRGLKIKSVDEFRKMSATSPHEAKKVQEDALKGHLGIGEGAIEQAG